MSNRGGVDGDQGEGPVVEDPRGKGVALEEQPVLLLALLQPELRFPPSVHVGP